jgi:hypothetical protein
MASASEAALLASSLTAVSFSSSMALAVLANVLEGCLWTLCLCALVVPGWRSAWLELFLARLGTHQRKMAHALGYDCASACQIDNFHANTRKMRKPRSMLMPLKARRKI